MRSDTLLNILWNIPAFNLYDGIFCRIMSVSQNIVMDLNNIVEGKPWKFECEGKYVGL